MKWLLKQTQILQGCELWKALRVATYVKTKVSGFYSLNGESLIEFSERNRSEDFISQEDKRGKSRKKDRNHSRFQNASCKVREAEKLNIAGLSPSLLSRFESD